MSDADEGVRDDADAPEAGPAFERALSLMRERERFVAVARGALLEPEQPHADREGRLAPAVVRYTRALRASGLPLERVLGLVTSALATTFEDAPDAGRAVLESVVHRVFEEFEAE
jgi:hypothetical protein